jgi:hypothetical protein
MMYAIVIPVHMELLNGGSLADAARQVVDQLAMIDDNTAEFLDYAVSSDASDGTVTFEITADAEDELQAVAGAVSWVRTAVHAAGGSTPGWNVRGVGAVEVEPATADCG